MASNIPCTNCCFLLGSIFLVLVSADYKLTLVHTGDVRCHFEPINLQNEDCTSDDLKRNECFGGWARLDTLVKGYRGIMENMLLLDVGNQFHGTLWFTVYRDEATSYFMNRTGYDAMAIGHHEFNLKPSGLVPFLRDADFPVLSCNIDDSNEPIMQDEYQKSTIVTVGGQRIGIIGFTYWATSEISNAGNLEFLDEVESVKIEAEKLMSLGVNKIIALGRSIFDIHLKIAREVPGIDVVIGGDLAEFLYSGNPPSTEVPTNPYPFVVQPNHDTSTNVLVVQAYKFGKYVGHLDVSFDDDGNLVEWDGNPILLDHTVKEDSETLQEIENWSKKVDEYANQHVGTTNVLLEGTGPNKIHKRSPCRLSECSFGNLVTDAFVQQHLEVPTEDHWNDVAIALMNAGGLRNTFEIGDVDRGDVLALLPYLNTIDTIDLKGRYLLQALEHSVQGYNVSDPAAKFLQFSGINVVYNLSKPDGQRVNKASVLCTDCKIPKYEPLDREKSYRFVTTNFLAEGGDGYDMIAENKLNHIFGELDSTILEEYIEQMSPLYHGRTGRIRFTHDDPPPCAYGGSVNLRLSLYVVVLSVVIAFIFNYQDCSSVGNCCKK